MFWIKDNGQEIEINDLPASIEHCKSLGWTPVEDPAIEGTERAKSVSDVKPATPKKKTAKKKAAKNK